MRSTYDRIILSKVPGTVLPAGTGTLDESVLSETSGCIQGKSQNRDASKSQQGCMEGVRTGDIFLLGHTKKKPKVCGAAVQKEKAIAEKKGAILPYFVGCNI